MNLETLKIEDSIIPNSSDMWNIMYVFSIKFKALHMKNVLWSNRAACIVHRETNRVADLEATAQLLAPIT